MNNETPYIVRGFSVNKTSLYSPAMTEYDGDAKYDLREVSIWNEYVNF